MREKTETEQYEKKLSSLDKDIKELREQRDKTKKRMKQLEDQLSEKLKRRNDLVVSYIVEPLGAKEVDFRQARYLRSQFAKGNFGDMQTPDQDNMSDDGQQEPVFQDHI